jgi:V/A-type H+-transporting ATPase subunit E
MDIQLQELIGKIKKDGIESASKDAEQLKAAARAEGERIVAEAKKEAEKIISAAKADAERSEKAGIASVEQASRNTILSFKGEIESLLDKIINEKVGQAYNAELLKKVIPQVLGVWASGKDSAVEVILSVGDLAEIESALRSELSAALKGGVEFKTARNMEGGFRIAEKASGAYYDFSAAQVAGAFAAYLNPRLAEIVQSAAAGITA